LLIGLTSQQDTEAAPNAKASLPGAAAASLARKDTTQLEANGFGLHMINFNICWVLAF
jgi:hypothetical protein